MTDIVERLRNDRGIGISLTLCREAAAEIERLQTQVAALREALENVLPLAESYLNIMPDRRGHNVAKLDRIRAALATGGDDE